MCKTNFCRKAAKRGNYCYSCLVRRYKKNNPERYAYATQKSNALARGHAFTVSFEYWLRFVQKTGYMAGRGITRTSLHVDKIIDELGYVEGNLQVLTNSQNVRKYLGYEFDENGKPYNFRINKRDNGKTDEDPF